MRPPQVRGRALGHQRHADRKRQGDQRGGQLQDRRALGPACGDELDRGDRDQAADEEDDDVGEREADALDPLRGEVENEADLRMVAPPIGDGAADESEDRQNQPGDFVRPEKRLWKTTRATTLASTRTSSPSSAPMTIVSASRSSARRTSGSDAAPPTAGSASVFALGRAQVAVRRHFRPTAPLCSPRDAGMVQKRRSSVSAWLSSPLAFFWRGRAFRPLTGGPRLGASSAK